MTDAEQQQAARCVGKVSFDSMTLAKKAAKRRRDRSDVALTPYRCKDCRKLHVGHDRKLPDRRRVYVSDPSE